MRKRTVVYVYAALLAAVIVAGELWPEGATTTRLELRNMSPSLSHPFGTDWLGRDMLARTIQGLSLSIRVGCLSAAISTCIALLAGLSAATLGKTVDRVIVWLIDLFLSVPHLVALILISFALGGGVKGVIVGIGLTHWPSLARVIRAEALQLLSADFIRVAHHLGQPRWRIVAGHIMPHVLPQMAVGGLLLFPHAILHEAAISFLGLGLSPHMPAIGIILSESMRYLASGMWWLALFPGLCLLVVVRILDRIGKRLYKGD